MSYLAQEIYREYGSFACFYAIAFHLHVPHCHFVIFKKAENGKSLHRDWMVDSNKTSSLEKVATLSSIVRSELLSKNILHLTVISRTWKIEWSYTMEILTLYFSSDIVREEERDARGKKSAIVEQSTEMTLYLYDISKLISRRDRLLLEYFFGCSLNIIY